MAYDDGKPTARGDDLERAIDAFELARYLALAVDLAAPIGKGVFCNELLRRSCLDRSPRP